MPEPLHPTPFHCVVEDVDAEIAHVRPFGELDLATAATLESMLRAARERGLHRVVVDLRGLEFMDSTGLSLLTRWSLRSRAAGYEFAVIPGRERVQRLFDLTGLSPHFTFIDG